MDYLFQQRILEEEAKSKLLEMEDVNYDYLLSGYILSLLNDEALTNGKYAYMSPQELTKMVRKYFVSEEAIYMFIYNSIRFDLGEIFNYVYGNIISLYLKDDVEAVGLDNNMMRDFLETRSEIFTPSFLERWNINPDGYQYKHLNNIKILQK